ncbi:hypothetical protein BGW41_000978 [Actinomortierella wolfii]|nr:hypothetical protein BGW41_000978 [Actinomortierella wolfii]
MIRRQKHKEALDDLDSPKVTLKTTDELIAEHPAVHPLKSTDKDQRESTVDTSSKKELAFTVLHIVLKPVYFLLFLLLHIGNELLISLRTLKTILRTWFLAHKYPVSPPEVRLLREDLEGQLAKKPSHLAVILPVMHGDEDTWQERVAELAQWSIATGIKCLSIMRTDAITADNLENLQTRMDYSIADFFQADNVTPIALARTLSPVVENFAKQAPTNVKKRLHNGRHFDLDVVILSERDGHERIAGTIQALGTASLEKKVSSNQIDMSYVNSVLAAELSEPELLIVFKDQLDLSSYPPWHIRLTEIYHDPDQYFIPQYTMFLEALYRYSKCEQRVGK